MGGAADDGDADAPRGGAGGVIHVATGRWVAFGSEARCRALVAHLTEVDTILQRRGAADAAGRGARRGTRR